MLGVDDRRIKHLQFSRCQRNAMKKRVVLNWTVLAQDRTIVSCNDLLSWNIRINLFVGKLELGAMHHLDVEEILGRTPARTIARTFPHTPLILVKGFGPAKTLIGDRFIYSLLFRPTFAVTNAKFTLKRSG